MRSQQAIENKINAWYGRFASNNGITLEEARKMLNSSELEELKWDVDEYIKAGKKNALTKQFKKQLENASAKYHINRLEAIKLQTQMECEKLYGNFTDALDEYIKSQYTDTYYKTAFEIQKGLGYGHSLERINSDMLEQIANKPWAVDGKNFKTRLGESKVKLINNVHNSLTQMCLMGTNPEQAIRTLAKTMQGDRGRAGRIIMTESAYFSQNAQKRCFNSLGVEEYEIVATLDSRTCGETCAGQDGEHYPMKMFEPGVTAPPFHPRCRCCTAPYFNDEWSKGERAARDEDGETYYVPSDMKYNDWHKAFVRNDTSSLQPTKRSAIIKPKPLSEKAKDIIDACKNNNIEYNEVQPLNMPLTTDEIIERLGGGDETDGSCSSLAFAYIGNRNSLDVLDFRGGRSCDFFSRNHNIIKICDLDDVMSYVESDYNDYKAINRLLKNVEEDKEYYFATGRHAAIIRKNKNGYEYLELQTVNDNGFKHLNNKILKERFGCQKSHTISGFKVTADNMLIDISSLAGNEDYKTILGYINTSSAKQMKGVNGYAK
ncbi:MAG: minor capsid protein [Lachnospiraceae bacterium]|nr:minor capsid protein [Lachnospiraceae bacterium]